MCLKDVKIVATDRQIAASFCLCGNNFLLIQENFVFLQSLTRTMEARESNIG